MADLEEIFFSSLKIYHLQFFYMSVYRYYTPSIDKIKRILGCFFEKSYLKKWYFFIIDKMCISGYKSWSRAGLSHMFEELF